MTNSLVAILSLLVLAAPAPGLTQTAAPSTGAATVRTGGAAATLPNSFDNPAAARAAVAPPPVAAGSTLPSSLAAVAAAETALKTTIAALQAGAPNYDDMSPELAGKVRELAGQIGPLVQGFGPLKTVTHVGTENGAELFMVAFDKQTTQWIIAQDPEHKIRALLFRPAPTEAASTPAP